MQIIDMHNEEFNLCAFISTSLIEIWCFVVFCSFKHINLDIKRKEVNNFFDFLMREMNVLLLL